ncbi:MAG: nucleotidyltransferase family protein, partial [Deltaproteobacteria bacterium]|nr:nucleotidyltransferase family protein [Deltaproteobacteria bacterium]
DPSALREAACREGLAGVVYARLKGRGLPRAVLSPLEDLYRHIAARNLANLEALGGIEDALRKTRIDVLVLKGASLLDYVYSGIGMRPMGDIDLMVRPGDLQGFANILCGLGYRRDPVLSHLFRREGVIVDLHTHALNTDRIAARTALFPLGMAPVWRRAVPWKLESRRLKRPEDRDNVLLLSQHLMKHSFSGLIWLTDIHELLRNRDLGFWKGLSRRAKALRQQRPLSYSLYLLNRVFGLEPPPGSGLEHPAAGISRIERGLLGARAAGRSIAPMGPLLALFCIPGSRKRAAFLWETLFPKRGVVRKEFSRAFRGRRTAFCMYRLIRAAKAARGQLSLILHGLVRGS